MPNPQLYEWFEVSIEPRVKAMPAGHPLAGRHDLDITDVLDQPFLALPAESGAWRDYWLANDFRNGESPLGCWYRSNFASRHRTGLYYHSAVSRLRVESLVRRTGNRRHQRLRCRELLPPDQL